MPAGKGKEAKPSESENAAQRKTFRPPWVKEGPPALPVPEAAWNPKNVRRDSNTETKTDNPLANIQLRKTSIPPKEVQENGTKENTFVKPPLKPVPPKSESTPKPKEDAFNVKLNKVANRIKKEPPKPKCEEIDREVPTLRNKLVREESMRKLNKVPAAPPMPPPPPPNVPPEFKRNPLTREKIEKLETLRARPKVRPDWTAMLKEIEGNKRLKHVECNDRSQPLLPEGKAKEHFLYESEKATAHNVLLKQIQQGICLKKVKTNDRSKPQLEGLRKFRRQMTIEEQIQKSVSMASIPPEEITDEIDEMDDIDKVRDDLQSTKQMLALELRNKEAQIRENKRLLAKIASLEAELEKERNQQKQKDSGEKGADDKIIKSLKEEALQAKKASETMEKKYTETSEQLITAKSELEDIKKQNKELEKRLQEALQGRRASGASRKDSVVNGKESDDEFDQSETSEESEDETEEKKEQRLQKQIKHLKNKLRNYKNKEDNAKKERVALREIIKKHQQAMKEEKKKYKVLQKEVNKMAALMKDVGSEDDEDEEEEDEEKEEEEEEVEEEEESTEESESEESDDDGSDSERSQSEPEDAPSVKKKDNYAARSARHEKILGAIKKGNYMLKTNAERLQDDLNKQKELTAALQEDLDSVLSELG